MPNLIDSARRAIPALACTPISLACLAAPAAGHPHPAAAHDAPATNAALVALHVERPRGRGSDTTELSATSAIAIGRPATMVRIDRPDGEQLQIAVTLR